MEKSRKVIFLLHAVVALIIGLPLLAAPGRFLGIFGWAPVDPLLSRVLGAALLGLAWSSLRGCQAKDKAQINTLVEMEAIFCILACLGLLRHLLIAYYPLIVWLIFLVLAIFAVLWIILWVKKPKADS